MHEMDDAKWFHFFWTCAGTLKVKPAPWHEPVEGGS
jgi:hypothetical protein